MNHIIRITLLLLSLFYIVPPVAAVTADAGESRPLRLFGDSRILSHQYNAFVLDRQGYLWVGSDQGLVRFDGTDYEQFRHDGDVAGSISSSTVRKIICDSRGGIWVGTADGLNYFDAETNSFRTVGLPDLSFNGFILDMAERQDGVIVFIVAGVGLYFVDISDDSLEAVRMGHVSEHYNINTLAAVPDGSLIGGTHYGRMVKIYPNGNIVGVDVTNDFFKGIRQAGGDKVVAFTNKGIWRVDVSTMDMAPIDTRGLGDLSITDVGIGADNTVYVGTMGGGVWCVGAGEDTLRPMRNLFHPSLNVDRNKIGAIYVAPDGNLWLGANHHGVLMLPSSPMPFSFHPLRRTIADFDGGITAMVVCDDGLWMAIDGNEVVNFSHSHRLRRRLHIPSERGICALYQADDKMLYAVSISDAIYRIDPSDGSVRRMLDLKYSSVRYSLAGGGSMPFLYIGIHGEGIMKYDVRTGEETLYDSGMLGEDRLHNDWIASSYIDSKKRLWIGLYSGMACYEIPADTFRVIEQTPFVSLGACNAIREICDGRLLIGTSCGLVLYDPDNDAVENVFTTSDGLCDNDVRTLEVDTGGVAWIGTMRGLSRLSVSDSRISSLQGGHGLGETTFLHSGFSRENGTMYYAGNLGYTVFQPSTIRPVSFSRPVRVSAVYLNGHRLTESHLSDGRPAVETDGSRTCRRINIAKDDNNLLLHLSTMDYRDPANVSYEWRFEDSDDTWFSTKPGSGAIVIPGLPPGDHILLVRATDNSMHSDITRLEIHVTPPWYLSVPAKIVYVLMLVAVIVLVFIIFRKKKNEEIYEAKVKFFMDISHEIRSPVTCIISPLETLANKEHDPETTAMLKGMQRNAGRILSLVNQLLEIRKIDKGKKRLSMQPVDMVEFASELVETYRPMACSKSIDISLDAGHGVEEVWIDRDNFDKVLVNLITNAIKYTPDGGQVRVSLDTVDDAALGKCARIQVTDTGIGLDPKHITRIFDRFYQGQRSPGGFGVGLNLARQLVSLHHGSLTASNRQDGVRGSVFTVLLPLGNSHLTFQEIHSATADGGHTAMPAGDFTNGKTGSDLSSAYSHASRRIAGNDTVLIVDDDRELREYLAFHFSRFCNVLEASDGAEALQLLLDNKVDIVVSDVVMPGTDGLALLKSVKTNTMTTHIPVILLSSRNDVADRMQGWEQGADGYIGKPFTITELESLVDSLIRNRLRLKGKYTGAQDNCSVEPEPDLMGNDQLLLEKITKVIEARVEDSSFNVETLGVEVGISRAHLHRKMKSLIGMTPSDFIRNVRLRRACEILARHDVDVAQVAYKVGFTSQPHFSTVFKKFTGMTPTEYRLHGDRKSR